MKSSATIVLAFALFDALVAVQAAGDEQADWTPALPGHDASLDGGLEHALLMSGASATPTIIPIEQRLQELQEALRPTYSLMSKNSGGNLDYPGVRYVLHRFFVWRHGWYMKTVGPMGDSWNNSTPDEILEGSDVPAQIKGLFEKRLGWRGLSLDEIAVLAAMLEDLVRGQYIDSLRQAYKILGMPTDKAVTPASLDTAMSIHLAFHILGDNITIASRRHVQEVMKAMSEVYPSWAALQSFAKNVREENSAGAERISFDNATAILTRFGDVQPDFHDADHCLKLKRHLVSMEDPGTGRVPLTKFYGDMAGKGMWQFSESPEYLKQLGALDNETMPGHPSVVIPNYITGLSNCVANSKYHWVCCRSECEVLLRHIETQVQVAEPEPEEILRAIKSMRSSVVPAGSKPPDQLVALARLQDIANANGGGVPLSGRLFAQWMHHAYPHECPYPHVAGTTNPLIPQDFETEQSASSVYTELEAVDLINHTVTDDTTKITVLPWVDVEELVIHKSHPMTHAELEEDQDVWAAVTFMSFVAILAASSVALLQVAKRVSKAFAAIKDTQPKLSAFDV